MEIREVRVSLLWTETILDHWGYAPNPELGLLTGGTAYEYFFERVQNGEVGSFEVPWKQDPKNRFWRCYLETPHLSGLSTSRAWKGLVPLCHMPRPRIRSDRSSPQQDVRRAQLLVYPHGQAFVLTLSLAGAQTLEQAARTLIGLRRGRLEATLGGGRTESGGMNRVATAVLEDGRRHVFGGRPAARGVTEPYRVVTFIQADGVEADTPADEATLELLKAITAWPVDGEPSAPEGAVRALLDSSEPGDVVCVGERARTIWYPRLLSSKEPPIHSLSCYHTNQTYAAAQVESLGGLVASTRSRVGGPRLHHWHRECVRRATGALTRFQSTGETSVEHERPGESTTYHSGPVREHVREEYLDDLGAIRRYLGFDLDGRGAP